MLGDAPVSACSKPQLGCTPVYTDTYIKAEWGQKVSDVDEKDVFTGAQSRGGGSAQQSNVSKAQIALELGIASNLPARWCREQAQVGRGVSRAHGNAPVVDLAV